MAISTYWQTENIQNYMGQSQRWREINELPKRRKINVAVRKRADNSTYRQAEKSTDYVSHSHLRGTVPETRRDKFPLNMRSP